MEDANYLMVLGIGLIAFFTAINFLLLVHLNDAISHLAKK